MNYNKFLKPALALSLVAVMAVGGTMAYLQYQTSKITNAFTFSDDSTVEIELIEKTFGDEGNTDPVPMVPSLDIAKDPEINNIGEDCYIYVDVVESCVATPYTFADFIDYSISPNWKEVSGITTNPAGTKTYVYTNGGTDPVVVAKDTQNLYILKDNKVTVKDTVTEAMLKLAKSNNPELSFVGYAIQSDNVAEADANTVFIDTFKSAS